MSPSLGSIRLCHSLWSLLMVFWINFLLPDLPRAAQKNKSMNAAPLGCEMATDSGSFHVPAATTGSHFPLLFGASGSGGWAALALPQPGSCSAARPPVIHPNPAPRPPAVKPRHIRHIPGIAGTEEPHTCRSGSWEGASGTIRALQGDLRIPGTIPRPRWPRGWRGSSGSARVTQQSCHRGQIVASPSVPVAILVRCHTSLASGWV